jgi:hypothetical protein
MDFQSFSKSHLLFEIRFYRQVPRTFVFITDRPLVHEKDPRKNEGDAMWSLAWRAAQLAGIGRLQRCPWPGKR